MESRRYKIAPFHFQEFPMSQAKRAAADALKDVLNEFEDDELLAGHDPKTLKRMIHALERGQQPLHDAPVYPPACPAVNRVDHLIAIMPCLDDLPLEPGDDAHVDLSMHTDGSPPEKLSLDERRLRAQLERIEDKRQQQLAQAPKPNDAEIERRGRAAYEECVRLGIIPG